MGFGTASYNKKTGKTTYSGLGGGTNGTSNTTASAYQNYLSSLQDGGSGATNYTTTTPDLVKNQMDSINKISTGYTPEQELAMRNRIRSTDTAQTQGSMNKIRELMAAQGYSGGGGETAQVQNLIRNQNATRQGALSDLDISNAQTDLANQYNKANLLNSMVNTGENARQFDIGTQSSDRQFNLGQAANMYQYGTSFDEDKRRYNQEQSDYASQLSDMLAKLGLSGTSSSSNKYSSNSGRYVGRVGGR